jgi:hypothetical protein
MSSTAIKPLPLDSAFRALIRRRSESMAKRQNLTAMDAQLTAETQHYRVPSIVVRARGISIFGGHVVKRWQHPLKREANTIFARSVVQA